METDLDVEAFKPVVDLWPTAVDQDGTKTDAGEQNEVIDNGSLKGLRFHSCAAILDHDSLASKFLDERQRFGENIDSELTRSGRVITVLLDHRVRD